MTNEVRTRGAYTTIETFGLNGNIEVKVRTINNCAVGQNSPIMILNTGNAPVPVILKPSRMAAPDVKVDTCSVIVTWRPTNTSGVVVSKYLLEIADRNGLF